MSANVERWKRSAGCCIERLSYRLFKTGPVDVACDRGYDKISLLGPDSRKPLATVTRQEAVILAIALLEAAEYSDDETMELEAEAAAAEDADKEGRKG